jgi:hypothetical protein
MPDNGPWITKTIIELEERVLEPAQATQGVTGMSASIRFDNEKQVVRQVCERLLRWGYSLGNVSDGEELMGATATKTRP